MFRVLKRLRFLRGTPFDPFGHSAERKAERQLIAEYETLIEEIVPALRPGNHALAVQLAVVARRRFAATGPSRRPRSPRCGARRDELLQKFRNRD